LLCLDDEEMYGKAEMAWGVVSDLKGFVTGQCYRGDGSKKELAELATPRFGRIAKELETNTFLIGKRICCADFAFVELVDMMDFISDGEIFVIHPSLLRYRDGIFALANVKECHEKEKQLPFNNKVARINSR